MHIAEGVLTGKSMAVTLVAGAAVVAWGAASMNKFVKEKPQRRPLLGMAGAFIFLVSFIPIPAFTGTTSHPCGTPLAGILLGPGIAAALSVVALALQAAFFAHGGFSSLGANTLTLGLVGAGSAWLTYRACRRLGLPIWFAAGLGGWVGDVLTYVAAGGILGAHLAFFAPNPQYSFGGYLKAIYLAYLPTQLPISIGEMFITGWALRSIARQRPEVLEDLGVEPKGSSRLPKAALLLLCLLPWAYRLTAAPAEPAAAVSSTAAATPHEVIGMDDAVNAKMAEHAGAPPRNPYLNLEAMGDLWNLVLMLGGGIAGFIVGRRWHLLFGPSPQAPLPSPEGTAKGEGGRR